MARTTTVSLLDRVEQIRESELPPVVAEKESLMEQAQEEYDDPWDIPDDIESRYDELQTEIKRLRGEANTLEEFAEKWEGDEFVIRELSVGTVSMVQDDVAEASDVDMEGQGTPKGGYARKRTLETAIEDKPHASPDIAEFPDAIGDFLFDCIDDFNTTGEVELGNSSLRAEMMSSDG